MNEFASRSVHMFTRVVLVISLFFFVADSEAQIKYIDDPGVTDTHMLNKINEIRAKGCRCGRKRMQPVPELKWNKTLHKSAYSYAKHMYDHNIFSHHSIDGKDVADRIEELGYEWQYAGENLAEGQKSFDIALRDWMASKTHCEMIMNPDMTEMGLAKYGKYWVHHFAAPLPKNKRRVKERYRQGD